MSETLEATATVVNQQQLAEQMLAEAKGQGVVLLGPNGLLTQLIKNASKTAAKTKDASEDGFMSTSATARRHSE
jgi:putative transposase